MYYHEEKPTYEKFAFRKPSKVPIWVPALVVLLLILTGFFLVRSLRPGHPTQKFGFVFY